VGQSSRKRTPWEEHQKVQNRGPKRRGQEWSVIGAIEEKKAAEAAMAAAAASAAASPSSATEVAATLTAGGK